MLNGHISEIICLAIAKTGAFVLIGAMDRQVRVWERTKDMVFLEEEKERAMEDMFVKVDNKGDEEGTERLMCRRKNEEVQEQDDKDNNEPQSAAAVKRSVLSVSSGDRIMEALERASLEGKGELTKERMPNPLLLNMKPPQYILWVLRSVKSAEFADFASESYGKTHVLPYCPSPQCSGCGIVRSCSNLPSQSASDVGSSSGIETVVKDSPGGGSRCDWV